MVPGFLMVRKVACGAFFGGWGCFYNYGIGDF